MLKSRENAPVRLEPLLRDQRETKQEVKRASEAVPPPREVLPLAEQDGTFFLERAQQDLVLLKANLAARWTSQGSAGAMVRAVSTYIEEAKRGHYDDGLYVTYRNCRDITRQWFCGGGLYTIFNTTLDAIEDGYVLRQKRRSDPELERENRTLKGAIAEKEASIRALQNAERESAQAKKSLEQTIKEKNEIIAGLSSTPLPSGSPSSEPLPRPQASAPSFF